MAEHLISCMPSSFLFWHPEGALAELHRAGVVLLVAREKGAVGDEVKRRKLESKVGFSFLISTKVDQPTSSARCTSFFFILRTPPLSHALPFFISYTSMFILFYFLRTPPFPIIPHPRLVFSLAGLLLHFYFLAHLHNY